jgi:hypothetical protein
MENYKFYCFLYAFEARSLTWREAYILRVFLNRVLRKLFGLNRDERMGYWRKLHNEELYNLCSIFYKCLRIDHGLLIADPCLPTISF